MSKGKRIDIGSNMSFNNRSRASYSLEGQKLPDAEEEKIVRMTISELEKAPEEWNFYPPLSEEDFEKLVLSILEHGLLHPIVVRKQEERSIILSGHNRVRAYEAILSDLALLEEGYSGQYIKEKNDHLRMADFQQIMAVLREDISDEEAREIIIDANYVQRQLNPRLVTRSVIEKYRIIQQKRKSGELQEHKNKKTRELVARELQLSGRHIDRYRRLEKLEHELVELFYQGRISLELASALAGLKPRVQQHIAENYRALLVKHPGRVAAELKPSLSMKEIDAIFDELALPKNEVRLVVVENGRTKNILLEDEKLIVRIKQLVGLD